MEAQNKIKTQLDACKSREELLDWFQHYTFGNCSNAEQIAITRDTVDNFIRHNPNNTIVHRTEEQPHDYEVYAGFGLVIVDLGEFRLVFADEN